MCVVQAKGKNQVSVSCRNMEPEDSNLPNSFANQMITDSVSENADSSNLEQDSLVVAERSMAVNDNGSSSNLGQPATPDSPASSIAQDEIVDEFEHLTTLSPKSPEDKNSAVSDPYNLRSRFVDKQVSGFCAGINT